jgi:hypothetical protein
MHSAPRLCTDLPLYTSIMQQPSSQHNTSDHDHHSDWLPLPLVNTKPTYGKQSNYGMAHASSTPFSSDGCQAISQPTRCQASNCNQTWRLQTLFRALGPTSVEPAGTRRQHRHLCHAMQTVARCCVPFSTLTFVLFLSTTSGKLCPLTVHKKTDYYYTRTVQDTMQQTLMSVAFEATTHSNWCCCCPAHSALHPV